MISIEVDETSYTPDRVELAINTETTDKFNNNLNKAFKGKYQQLIQ